MTEPVAVNPGAAGAPAAPGGRPDVVLELRGVDKTFAGTHALRDASLIVRRGTVHAFLGGNGSGKSTTIKILAGVYGADSGSLRILGRDFDLSSYSPADAHRAGLRFVHQDLGLFEALSIEENFALGAGYPVRGPQIDWRQLRRRVSALLAEYEVAADPRQPVNTLRPSDKTMVAIARALQSQQDTGELILVLDEPTARLAAHESELLLDRVRRRAELGQTIILVSHRLTEVLAVASDFTIYRDGRVAGTIVGEVPTEDRLISVMAGGLVAALRPTGTASHSTGTPVLEIEGLHTGPACGIDLTVHAGEIVGLTGLVGSGRSSVLKTLFGVVRPVAGSVRLGGKPYRPKTIAEAMKAGVALVPEDRAGEAAFPDRSVSDNISVAKLRENFRGWMSRRREIADALQLISQLGIKAAGPEAVLSSLSGGNQQKVIFGRWLQRQPRLLLLDEPTQGVDVMSRSDIYALIRRAAAGGLAVLLASSDLAEIHALSDRILILSGGQLRHEVSPTDVDVDELTSLVLRAGTTSSSSPTTPSTEPAQ